MHSGKIHYETDGEEDVLPDDLLNEKKYLSIPSKHDFALGKPLVMSFICQYLPQRLHDTDQIFRERGAYGRFKELLQKENQLEAWYAFEQKAIKEPLTDW